MSPTGNIIEKVLQLDMKRPLNSQYLIQLNSIATRQKKSLNTRVNKMLITINIKMKHSKLSKSKQLNQRKNTTKKK